MNLYFVALGCDKNKVDSFKALDFFIEKNHWTLVNDIEEADVAIVNTCAFILDAKNESIDIIKELYEYKKKGKLKKLIVMGCLVKELQLDTNSKFKIDKYADDLLDLNDYLSKFEKRTKRFSDILDFSTSIKIADGCNKNCSYCIIPKLRGRYKSAKIEDIIEEATSLVKNGTREISLVAQETLSYGIDLYKKRRIVDLIDELSKIKKLKWIRLLYCYPEEITDDVINLFKKNKKLCNYIDIPIQHSEDHILKMMNRPTTKNKIKNIVSKLRVEIKDIIIRTTIIVGFPGETEEDFKNLCEFVKEMKFDKLGVFTYSREKLSSSYSFNNQVPEDVKINRKKILLDIQKKIVKENNKQKIGKIYDVIIEGYDSRKKMYVGRNFENARDIDDLIYFKSVNKNLISGDFIKIKIINFKNYDLIGDIYEDEFAK